MRLLLIAMFKSKALDTDDKFSFTFATPGVYDYFCSLHPHVNGNRGKMKPSSFHRYFSAAGVPGASGRVFTSTTPSLIRTR
jgi:hypothetical protein